MQNASILLSKRENVVYGLGIDGKFKNSTNWYN